MMQGAGVRILLLLTGGAGFIGSAPCRLPAIRWWWEPLHARYGGSRLGLVSA